MFPLRRSSSDWRVGSPLVERGERSMLMLMAGNGSNSKCMLDRERKKERENGWRSLIQNVKGR